MNSQRESMALMLHDSEYSRLDGLRSLVYQFSQTDEWDPVYDRQILFDMRNAISDINPKIAVAALQFLKIWSCSENIDDIQIFQIVLPHVLARMNSNSVDIRSNISSLLRVHVMIPESRRLTMNLMIDIGFNSPDWNVRLETLQIICESDLFDVDLTTLISSVSFLLKDISYSVVVLASKTLLKIKLSLGIEGIDGVPKEQREILNNHQDSYHESSWTGDLKFGFIPAQLIKDILNKDDWKTRCYSIERIWTLLQTVPVQTLADNIDSLLYLTRKLLNDDNFKIVLTSLNMLVQITECLGVKSAHYLKMIVPIVMDQCKPGKNLISATCKKALILLMRNLGLNLVLVHVLNYSKSATCFVKVNVFNLISTAMLTFPNQSEIFMNIITEQLVQGLNDNDTSVHYSALECYNLLANQMLPMRLVDKIAHIDDHMEMLLKRRSKDARLPRLNQYGELESVSKNVVTEEQDDNSTESTAVISISPHEKFEQEAVSIENALNNMVQISVNLEDTWNKKSPLPGIKRSSIQKPATLSSILSQKVDFAKTINNESMFTLVDSTESIDLPPIKQRGPKKITVKQLKRTLPPIVIEQTKSPSCRLKALASEMKNEDWSISQDAITEFYELLSGKEETFKNLALSEYLPSVCSQIQNLRSTISKVSILTCKKLFAVMPKEIEPFLETMTTCLLKKIGEGNTFINDEVDQSLDSMARNVSPIRAICALLRSCGHRNAQIRMRVALNIDKIISGVSESTLEKLTFRSLKDSERLLSTFVGYFKEGNGETRNAAKNSIHIMSKLQNFQEQLPKVLSLTKCGEVREMLRSFALKDITRSIDTPLADNLSLLPQIKKKKLVNNPVAIDEATQLEYFLVELNSDGYFNLNVDWQKKLEAVGSIMEYLVRHKSSIDKFKLKSIIDQFTQKINDGNGKVVLKILKSLPELISLVGVKIELRLE